MSADGVDATLSERHHTHGDYACTARTAQELKGTMRSAPGWDALPDDMRESLDLMMTKVARVLNGNPEDPDHWHDIAGYARLIERRLTGAGPLR